MKTMRTIIFITSFLMTLTVSAHVGLKSSVPIENTSTNSSPKQLTLIFSGKVRLVKLQLLNVANEAIDFGFQASSDAGQQFNNVLPELSADEYTVNWTVLGSDGHKMSDSFTFKVNEGEPTQAKTSHEGHDNQDQHKH